VELSRDGGGSLDVVEIDAASHNGVDDARDIRERAIFAPARDRYKIFILDEAHMVTPQGFNALLKIVEEPPEHVKFIFATTEPEKVIGTIRSRTHHYPFRLVPPAQMLEYTQTLCDSEGIQVAPGVLPLVVRAGGGSPRDTLSLLDQLMAGSDGASIQYERAVALLGYTHGALLDETIDAIAARDSAAAFDAADRVIQTGQDPRRFVEDLLERMRDLIIVAATSAEGAAAVLRGVPQDELDRMAVQASKFGPAELSRTADILNAALTEMTGATAPRLHLELMIARALIPASDDSTRGALARVERLERRVGVDGRIDTVAGDLDAAGEQNARTDAAGQRPVTAQNQAPAASAPAPESSRAAPLAPSPPVPSASGASAENGAVAPVFGDASTTVAPVPTPSPAAIGPVTLQQIRDAWPEILEAVKAAKMNAWLVVFTARVLELRGEDVLVMSFPSQSDVDSFKQQQPTGKGVSEYLRAAIIDVLGLRVKFVARADAAPSDSSPQQPAVRITSQPATDAAAPSPDTAASGARANNDGTGTSAGGTAHGANTGSSSSPRGTGSTTPNATTARATRGAATPSATPTATTTVPRTTTGWATVAIPGSPSVSGEPGAGEAAGSPVATLTAPTPPAAFETEPPFDEEPPPYDDMPEYEAVDPGPPVGEPSGWSTSAPPEPEAWAPSAAAAPTAKEATAPAASAKAVHSPGAPSSAATPAAAKPVTRAAAKPTRASTQKPPAFEEKQRYGESVVREILGATFLEEQPHISAQRSRGE
jgi:DNA polymerase-3 subunit gamma/tau